MEEQLEAVPHGLREPLDVHAKGRGEERGVQSVSKINCLGKTQDCALPRSSLPSCIHTKGIKEERSGSHHRHPPS